MDNITLRAGNSSLQNGKYIITKVLGQGGFGITYEAEQVSLGRKVAIKEFFMKEYCNRDGSTSRVSVPSSGSRELVERFRQKFLREARMIASFNHPNIVKIYDVFEENDTAYYVMEYLPGGSLSDKVRNCGALSENQCLNYILQVSSALDYLHHRNTLHFDVKPSNILFDEDSRAVLVDFGISKHYDTGGHQTSSTPVGLSKGYAPLEQYRQDDVSTFTPSTDIYSLGATLYNLATGMMPPDASIVNEEGLERPIGISDRLWNTIERSMQPRRKDRPQSIKEFQSLLEGTGGTEDDSTIVEIPKPVEHQPTNGSSPILPPNPEPDPKTKKGLSKWLYGVIVVSLVSFIALIVIPRLYFDEETPEPDKPEQIVNSDSTIKPEESKPIEPKVVAVTSISLNKTYLTLEEGSSTILTVRYIPSDATDKSTTWKSTDTKVATISDVGKVTAVKAGNATIIATCGDLESYCNLTVSQKTIKLTSISLDRTTLTLVEGSTYMLTVKYTPSNATDKNTTWKSIDTSVATVDSEGKVTALKAGKGLIMATCGGKDAYCEVIVSAKSQPVQQQNSSSTTTVSTPLSTTSSVGIVTGITNGYEWVDLGLSVKWATCNVGATRPEGYGDYYAWGETIPKSYYTWSNYKHCDGSDTKLTKYCNQKIYGYYNFSDGKTKLELSDDVARMKWGGSWRMPTIDEFKELKENCTWKWSTQNGVNGYKVTSNKSGYTSSSIFLPAAGTRWNTTLSFAGSSGTYWSSSLNARTTLDAHVLDFGLDYYTTTNIGTRSEGKSVRPVCP